MIQPNDQFVARSTRDSLLTESLKKQVAKNAIELEKQVAGELVKAMASASPNLDKFVSWCLAGTGATAALLASNVEKIEPILGSTPTGFLFITIVASILCGSASKFLSVRVQISIRVMTRMQPNVKKLEEEHKNKSRALVIEAAPLGLVLDTRLNSDRLTETIVGLFPLGYRYFARRTFVAALADPLRPFRLIAGLLVRQFWWCVAQLFFMVAGLVSLALV